LAFNENSLSFKFVQNIDPGFFKKHLDAIKVEEKDFYDDLNGILN